MDEEFLKLQKLGWDLPKMNAMGLFSLRVVDESKISFPSKSFELSEGDAGSSGFWAMERAAMIAKMLSSSGVDTLWEIGAGNGLAAIPLRDTGLQIIAVEPLQSGAVTLAKNGFPTFHATLEDLKLPDNSIKAVGAFDVLEHLEEPGILLNEICRVLEPGGVFICSVPAYQWLFSDFDEAIGHYRRYSESSLDKLVELNGFCKLNSTFLFGFLVLPALLFRRIPYVLGRRREFHSVFDSNKKSNYTINLINSILKLISRIERIFKFRFGLSIISIYSKK
jgi:SAM-dependent methyltransferase